MIKCDLLKVLFVSNFHKKIVHKILSNIFGTEKKRFCHKDKRNVLTND